MGKYVIRKSKVGFYFNVEAANGQVIATAQSYKSKPSCKSAIVALKKLVNAPIEDLTIKTLQDTPIQNGRFTRTAKMNSASACWPQTATT